MEKANQGCAVADTAEKTNFTLSMQRLIERQCVIQAVAIVSHPRAVKFFARIAPKGVPPHLAPTLSPRKVRARAVSKIESRTNVRGDIGVTVIPLVPTRV